MKTSLPSVLTCLLASQVITASVNGQSANTALSNLGTTSVNADLVPSADNLRSLGSSGKAWKQLYVKSLVFMGGARFLAYGNAISLQNTGVGSFSIASTTTGYNNTGVGAYTLRANVSGYNNVAVGYTSLFKSVAGHNNVAVGAASLYNNTSGVSNSAFGNNALLSNTTGSNNMAIGANASYYNSTGSGNVAIGIRALFSSKVGNHSVAIGDSAMLNFTGPNSSGNTAIGFNAMRDDITGVGNTAVGELAYSTGTGTNNTAIGDLAMAYATSGYSNTGVGVAALWSNKTGNDNSALGSGALAANSSGSFNTGIGDYALNYNSTGNYNTGIGGYALTHSLGDQNTAVGYNALAASTSGAYNVAVGGSALVGLQLAFGNTAVGYGSLALPRGPSDFNVAVGYRAGIANGGTRNIFIGAYADANAVGWQNSVAIGYGAVISDNDQIRLGNESLISVASTGQYVYLSDGRFKKNIKKDVPGLNFIKLLEPVTYNVDAHGLHTKLSAGTGGSSKDFPEEKPVADENSMLKKEQILYTGFVAQDVEKAAAKVNYDFSGVHKPTSDHDVYGLAYSEFVVPLVKAVQQLSDSNDVKQKKIDSLTGGMDSLTRTVNELTLRLEKLEATLTGNGSGVTVSDASLSQNIPNPVTFSTVISYRLPQTTGRAKIMITDLSGRVLQTIPLSGSGSGSVTVNTAKLSAGTYPYALYVDNIIAGTKQMLVIK